MEAAAALHQTKARSEPLLHVMFVSTYYIGHIYIDLLDAIASVGLPMSVCPCVHVLIDAGISTCELM